jgi:D-threo-aldose 1-dehydrogenase
MTIESIPRYQDPTSRTRIGRTGLLASRLGIGAGTQSNVDGAAAVEGMFSRAWELGLRYFDTAPLYLNGDAERRLGSFLGAHDRDLALISTKVGRLPDAEQGATVSDRRQFDYTASGTRRSIEGSLERLGLDRIDIAFVHDLDRGMHGELLEQRVEEVLSGCLPELDALRSEGVVGAIGISSRSSDVCMRVASELRVDCFMMAGAYTLLSHAPGRELLPFCVTNDIAVLIASPFNTGILATGLPTSTFDYGTSDSDVITRVRELVEVAQLYDIPIASAALQFPLRHPAVASVVVGHRSAAEVDRNIDGLRRVLPDDFWAELVYRGLIPKEPTS